MKLHNLYLNLSTRVIRQLAVALTVLACLLLLNFAFVQAFYFDNRQLTIGVVINIGIVILLCAGIGNIVFHLLRYQREEAVVAQFVGNVETQANVLQDLPPTSFVIARYDRIRAIHKVGGNIDHSALAVVLYAVESGRFGLIRFISNILILTGVFGTVVSLSIAMLGVSGVIDSGSNSVAGIALVIQGMSTALSTTITAVVAYVLFTYFYIRLNDVQTRLLGTIEYLTLVYLLPLCARSNEDIAARLDDLEKSLDTALITLEMTRELYQSSIHSLQQAIGDRRMQVETLEGELQTMQKLLRAGFRLSK